MMRLLVFLMVLLIAPLGFAQGVFEGSGEVNDPNCVGDGCGFVPADQAGQENGQSYEYGNAATDADS